MIFDTIRTDCCVEVGRNDKIAPYEKTKIKYMVKFLHNTENSITFADANKKYRGVEQLVARQAHNLEVACSSPASATNIGKTS